MAAGSRADGRRPEGPCSSSVARHLRRRRNGDKRRGAACHVESPPMSRADLIRTYISALPFAPVAIVAVPGGGCRIATAAPGAPGEKIAKLYYFKPSHIELVLGAAGLGAGPIDEVPAAVAALLEKTARSMGAPYETAAELRAAAEQEVDKIVAKVQAMRWDGEMKEVNRRYKNYRLAQVAMGKTAKPYSAYLQHFTAGLVRGAAMTGWMI
jgi:hypothetical protein